MTAAISSAPGFPKRVQRLSVLWKWMFSAISSLVHGHAAQLQHLNLAAR